MPEELKPGTAPEAGDNPEDILSDDDFDLSTLPEPARNRILSLQTENSNLKKKTESLTNSTNAATRVQGSLTARLAKVHDFLSQRGIDPSAQNIETALNSLGDQLSAAEQAELVRLENERLNAENAELKTAKLARDRETFLNSVMDEWNIDPVARPFAISHVEKLVTEKNGKFEFKSKDSTFEMIKKVNPSWILTKAKGGTGELVDVSADGYPPGDPRLWDAKSKGDYMREHGRESYSQLIAPYIQADATALKETQASRANTFRRQPIKK